MIKFLREIFFPKLILLINNNFKIYFVILLVFITYSFRIFQLIKDKRMYYINVPIVKIHRKDKIKIEINKEVTEFKLSGLDFPGRFDKCNSNFNDLSEKFIKQKLKIGDLVDVKIIHRNYFSSDSIIIFKENKNINDLIIEKFDMKNQKINFCEKIRYINTEE